MLAFIGFIFILSLILGCNFWDALGGFFQFILNAFIVCVILAIIGKIFTGLANEDKTIKKK